MAKCDEDIQRMIEDAQTNRPSLPRIQVVEKADGKPGLYAYMEMGYSSYDEYLKSPLWKKIRKDVALRDHYRCCRCGGNLHAYSLFPGHPRHWYYIHHRSYHREVMEGKANEFLATICEGCHRVIEADCDGKERTMAEKDALLLGPCPVDFPNPTRHPWLKGVSVSDCPRESYDRMSAVQRVCWFRKSLSVARKRNRKPPHAPHHWSKWTRRQKEEWIAANTKSQRSP